MADNDRTELITRAATVAASSVNEKARTAEAVWSTGARVLRRPFFAEPFNEELSLNPKHVRMERLKNGAPVLDSHRGWSTRSVIGVVESARIDKGRAVATLRFDTGAEGDDVFRKVRDGILRSVSVGYQVHEWETTQGKDGEPPTRRAIDWEPYEISVVPMGADASAQIREEQTMSTRSHNPSQPEIETPEQGADERKRCAAISRIGHTLRLPEMAARHIADGTSVDDFRAAALEEYGKTNNTPIEDAGRVGINEMITGGTRQYDHQRTGLMAEALASRFGGPAPSDEARQYLRLSVVDFARHMLESRGISTRLMSKNQIIERSLGGLHSTSDFPHLLTETGNRILRRSYEAYQGGLRRACRQVAAADFRPIQKLQVSLEAGTLKKVNEGGEFTRTTMFESKEAYSLATFGRIFGITRQALVNDDLGAFGEMNTKLGRAAAEFVASQLVALLVSNPTMGNDSKAVFHADHGNLDSTGAAISVTSLGAALKAMRLQKGLDGVTAIDVTPRYLTVPAALETVSRQVLTQLMPAQVSDVNPFWDSLELIVEPRLDASDANAWYVAADPAVIDTIEYAFLEGEPGPQLAIKEGWDVDGTEFKVRLDFGAGVIDYRGLYKNVGA